MGVNIILSADEVADGWIVACYFHSCISKTVSYQKPS